jgi:pimeloyl-ACP methyl ester carboxylesterase
MSVPQPTAPVDLDHDRAGPGDAGPPVVLLHGLTSSREGYRAIVDHLVAAGRAVVAADLRGHGGSPRAGRYRAVDYAGDVASLIDQLGRGPAIVVGHSLGGLTAHALAQRQPQVVAGLFLEDPPLFEGDDRRRADSPAAGAFPALIQFMTDVQQAGAGTEAVAAKVAGFPSPYGGTMADRLDADRLAVRARSLLRTDVAAVEAAVDGDLWIGYDPTQPVACPLTVLRADPAYGAVFLTGDAEALTAACQQADVVPIAGIGHAMHGDPQGEAPYLAELDRFLAAHR